MLASVDLPKYYPEKPQIGKILSIDKDDVELLWYYGTWSGPWKVFKKRQGRSMVDMKEVIPKSSIKLFNFTLTNAGRLKQATKTHLKMLYKIHDSVVE